MNVELGLQRKVVIASSVLFETLDVVGAEVELYFY